jgi:hypothetical protein
MLQNVPSRFGRQGRVDGNRHVTRHPARQIRNNPPGTVLGTDGDLRVGWQLERLNVPRHFLGLVQRFLKGKRFDARLAAHGLSHEGTVTVLGYIGIEEVEEGFVVRHGGSSRLGVGEMKSESATRWGDFRRGFFTLSQLATSFLVLKLIFRSSVFCENTPVSREDLPGNHRRNPT